MKLVNFHADDSLLERFDERARVLGLTRTELLNSMIELVVRIFEDASFAQKTKALLLNLAAESGVEKNEARSFALGNAEAYRVAKKER